MTNLPLSAPLPSAGLSPAPGIGPTGLPQKTAADYPQKFEDIAPGSTIRVAGRAVEVPFNATVLDAIAEYGPTGIPAVLITDGSQEYYIPASGAYEVQVLVDGRQLAATMPMPESGQKVRTVVRTGEAVRFRGGIESAAEIVRWAVGSATFRYIRETDIATDHLLQAGINGAPVWPGDWVLKDDEGKFHVIPADTFAGEWEKA